MRAAELCINAMATTMAPDMIIRVLAPLIATEEYPINLASVKMLTRLVENKGSNPVSSYLGDLMPGLIQVKINYHSNIDIILGNLEENHLFNLLLDFF